MFFPLFITRLFIIAKYKFSYIKFKLINNYNILSSKLITYGANFIK